MSNRYFKFDDKFGGIGMPDGTALPMSEDSIVAELNALLEKIEAQEKTLAEAIDLLTSARCIAERKASVSTFVVY